MQLNLQPNSLKKPNFSSIKNYNIPTKKPQYSSTSSILVTAHL